MEIDFDLQKTFHLPCSAISCLLEAYGESLIGNILTKIHESFYWKKKKREGLGLLKNKETNTYELHNVW